MFEGRKFECQLKVDENTQRKDLNSEEPNNTGNEDINTDADRWIAGTLPSRLSTVSLIALDTPL